jgi:hypothetical protein
MRPGTDGPLMRTPTPLITNPPAHGVALRRRFAASMSSSFASGADPLSGAVIVTDDGSGLAVANRNLIGGHVGTSFEGGRLSSE